MAEAVAEGAACRPNFSGPGRTRRLRVGIGAAVGAVLVLTGLVAVDAAWGWRVLVALPVGMAALSLMQVTRHTCVMHAAHGNFEQDDFSTIRQSEADAAASRKVAASITRDALIFALVAGVVAASTAWVV